MEVGEMRRALMDSTIHVVAQGDFDKATTRAISSGAGLNDAYIYRLFDSKRGLFKATFSHLDKRLCSMLLRYMPIIEVSSMDMQKRCWMYFSHVWEKVLSDYEKCFYFMRYYHSAYFSDCSSEERKKDYKLVIERLTPVFKPNVDVWFELNVIFDIAFATALKVVRGYIPHDKATAKKVFNLICLVENSKLVSLQTHSKVTSIEEIERMHIS